MAKVLCSAGNLPPADTKPDGCCDDDEAMGCDEDETMGSDDDETIEPPPPRCAVPKWLWTPTEKLW